MLWIVDYVDPNNESSDCLVIEADSKESAMNQAVEELKILKIPKRYILKMEVQPWQNAQFVRRQFTSEIR